MKETNHIPTLRIPFDAPLRDVINEKHPLLLSADGSSLEARLLNAWRRTPGYRYFFDRSALPRLIRRVPDDEWSRYHCAFREITRRLVPPSERPVLPRDSNGRIVWDCYLTKDPEYVCRVNRFAWFPGLALVARTGHASDAERVFEIWDDWIEQNPILTDQIQGRGDTFLYKPWGPLQAGLRLKHWMLALHILWNSPGLTPDRFARYVLAIRRHAVWLSHVSPRLWPEAHHNHFVMEMEGLLHGSWLPWLRESQELRNTAVHNLFRCVRRQVLADGVHVERAPAYHASVMQWVSLPLLLCQWNGIRIPHDIWRKVEAMLDFCLFMRTPEGWIQRFADSFVPVDGYQSERLLAQLFGRRLPVRVGRQRHVFWFLQHPRCFSAGRTRRWGKNRHFAHGGFAVARSGWGRRASMLAVKLDGYGGGHSHADYLSFCFSWNGRTIVDERGCLGYFNTRAAVACKLAPAHNVVLLGQRDMHTIGNPSRYWDHRPPIVEVRDVFFRSFKGGKVITGGRVVWPDGAWWNREITFSPACGLQIRDRVYTPRAERIRIQFHLASENVRRDGRTTLHTADMGQPNVQLIFWGTTSVCIRLQRIMIHGGGKDQPATRVGVDIPPTQSGTWETRIKGLRGGT